MPNWCENRLEIYFSNESEKEYALKLIENFEKDNFLNFIKPMPKNQPDLTKPNPFLADGGIGMDSNGFGENNWYDWSIKNWGTKWEIQGGGYLLLSNSVIFNFDSAWSPPVLAFDNFKLHFKLEYFESGASYYGIASNTSGELEDTSESIHFKAKRYDDLDIIREAMVEMALNDGIDTSIIDNLNMPDAYYNDDYEDDEEGNVEPEQLTN